MATVFEPVSGSRAGPGARSAGGARWDQPGWKGWLQGNSQTEEDSYSIIFLWGELRLVSVKELFFLQSGCLEEAREVATPSSCAFQGFCSRLGLSCTPTTSLIPISFTARPSARCEARIVLAVVSCRCGRCFVATAMSCPDATAVETSGTGALRTRATAACFRARGIPE